MSELTGIGLKLINENNKIGFFEVSSIFSKAINR